MNAVATPPCRFLPARRGWMLPLLLAALLPPALRADSSPEEMRSPENQVFQFMQRGTFVYAPDSTVTAAAYLWIPDHCRRLRGLLILGQNVPEHTLVGHPAIRAACAANDLGIVWSTPSYFSTKNKNHSKTVAFLQSLLDGLAASSGYDEVATVPWVPIGESGHLLMVDALLDGAPNRCIAGIYVKNAHWFCKNRQTPFLVAVGTAQEWDQDKADIRTRWKNLGFYEAILKERTAFPQWPVSLLVDGGSGHFDCPEAMVRYFADYISAAVRARVPADPSQPLIPVGPGDGYYSGLQLPGRPVISPVAAANADFAQRLLPWYFTQALAQASFDASGINWAADSQVPTFLDVQGHPVSMTFKGVTNPVPMVTGADGVTFEIKAGLLPAIAANFAEAGQPLAQAPGSPIVEWICGPVAPHRTWPQSPVCIDGPQDGHTVHSERCPARLPFLTPNSAGAAQTIAFDEMPNVPAGVPSVPLVARSDSGLPVDFFVVAGPAIVDRGRLVFTPIPPRTRLPVRVTVTAWQWGRSVEPQVRTAKPVTRSFELGSR